MIYNILKKLIKNIFNKILIPFDLKIESKSKSTYKDQQLKVATKLIQINTSHDNQLIPNKTECIVFSMDRAMQLHALLASYIHHVKNPALVHILYRASNQEHDLAYQDVFKEFPSVIKCTVKQSSTTEFRSLLLNILSTIKALKIFFLVDDNVFIESFDLKELESLDSKLFIPSFRLGCNLNFNYTRQKSQTLPSLILLNETPNKSIDNELLSWTWKDGEHDWTYPLSVDGHLFNKSEIQLLSEMTNFNSPNTYEANLQQYNHFYLHRRGICYRKSRMMNIPCNKVQHDFANIHGKVHQDELLKFWQQGYCINFISLSGYINISAHQDISLDFIKRNHL